MHEGRGLLEEGRGYSMGVGGSCSMHNPWLVVPHPRGVGRLGAGAGRQPSVHSADINEPAAETASEDRWNTAVSSRCATPVRLQCQHHGHRRPAGRMRRAPAKPNRLARSILRSRGRGLKARPRDLPYDGAGRRFAAAQPRHVCYSLAMKIRRLASAQMATCSVSKEDDSKRLGSSCIMCSMSRIASAFSLGTVVKTFPPGTYWRRSG